MKRSGCSWAQRQQYKYEFLPLWPLLIVIFNRTIDPSSCRDVTSLNFRAVKAPSCFGRSSWPSWGGRRWSPASWGWRRCSKTWFWRRGGSWRSFRRREQGRKQRLPSTTFLSSSGTCGSAVGDQGVSGPPCLQAVAFLSYLPRIGCLLNWPSRYKWVNCSVSLGSPSCAQSCFLSTYTCVWQGNGNL